MHDQVPVAMPARTPMRFSLRSLFVTTTLIAFVFFALIWLANNFNPGVFPAVRPKPFDQKLWKAWSINDMRQSDDIRRAFARRDMLDDLLARYNFAGWTGSQLTKLLGPSNPEFCPNEWDVAYLLGCDWVDYVVLVIRFDKKGKVERYEILMF